MTSVVGALHAPQKGSEPVPVRGEISDFRLGDRARWKRIRQWNRIGESDARFLPRINLNPAGNPIEERSDLQVFRRRGAGWNMIILSWQWGFDGCIAYNVFPYEDLDPKNIQNWLGPMAEDTIKVANSLIANDLKSFDGAIAAWGGNNNALRFVPALLKALKSKRRHPLALWCIKENADGSPKHPARVSHGVKPKPWRNLE